MLAVAPGGLARERFSGMSNPNAVSAIKSIRKLPPYIEPLCTLHTAHSLVPGLSMFVDGAGAGAVAPCSFVSGIYECVASVRQWASDEA